jgi:hypothetical protein
MSRQFDNVFINSDDDACFVSCGCGSTTHGSIRFDISDGPEDGEWWVVWAAWLTVNMVPFPSLGGRIRQAWGVLRGKPWEGDFELSARETKLMGEWLVRKANHCIEQRSAEEAGTL